MKLKESTLVELANVETSWKQYVGAVFNTNRSLWLESFFDRVNLPEGDFNKTNPQDGMSELYPQLGVRAPFLSQSVLHYGRKDNKFYLLLEEQNAKGDLVESLAWNEADNPVKDSVVPDAYLMRFWSFLRYNGYSERWIQYWFDMIYESVDSKSIVDIAEVGGGYGLAEDGQAADLDDWVKYCIAEIQSHMSTFKGYDKLIID